MKKNEVPGHMIKMFGSYLQDRHVTVDFNGLSAGKRTSQDCVQGSKCGSGLFILVANDLLQKLTFEDGVFSFAFSDDFLLIIRGKTTEELKEKANKVLEMVFQWGTSMQLAFNPFKTQAMLFHQTSRVNWPEISMILFYKEMILSSTWVYF